MKEIFRVVLIFTLTTLTLASQRACQTSRTGSNDELIITKVIHDSFAWALTKDRALFESIFAKDDDFFTYYPDSKSTVVGWTQFQKYLDKWMDPRNKAISFEIRNLRLVMAKTGDVAWFSAVVDDAGEWDGKPWGSKDVRWTGALEKRQGRWVIVQQHMSFAADTAPKPNRKQERAAPPDDRGPFRSGLGACALMTRLHLFLSRKSDLDWVDSVFIEESRSNPHKEG
ncbi:MAG: nuclear transport factor 2 family protein [Candidatus Aminicenantes bacterium]|nr:nuclear transport factor 2 family protein [Candidatus Aminicenantes bacterium]